MTIDELRQRLEEKAAHLKFDITDMILVEPGASRKAILDAEERLHVSFPDDFSKLVQRFDFSRLSLANLIFEYGHDLEKLVNANLGIPAPWWRTDVRSSTLLLVGTTDGHAIFQSLADGRIIATEKAAAGEKSELAIARISKN